MLLTRFYCTLFITLDGGNIASIRHKKGLSQRPNSAADESCPSEVLAVMSVSNTNLSTVLQHQANTYTPSEASSGVVPKSTLSSHSNASSLTHKSKITEESSVSDPFEPLRELYRSRRHLEEQRRKANSNILAIDRSKEKPLVYNKFADRNSEALRSFKSQWDVSSKYLNRSRFCLREKTPYPYPAKGRRDEEYPQEYPQPYSQYHFSLPRVRGIKTSSPSDCSKKYHYPNIVSPEPFLAHNRWSCELSAVGNVPIGAVPSEGSDEASCISRTSTGCRNSIESSDCSPALDTVTEDSCSPQTSTEDCYEGTNIISQHLEDWQKKVDSALPFDRHARLSSFRDAVGVLDSEYSLKSNSAVDSTLSTLIGTLKQACQQEESGGGKCWR